MPGPVNRATKTLRLGANADLIRIGFRHGELMPDILPGVADKKAPQGAPAGPGKFEAGLPSLRKSVPGLQVIDASSGRRLIPDLVRAGAVNQDAGGDFVRIFVGVGILEAAITIIVQQHLVAVFSPDVAQAVGIAVSRGALLGGRIVEADGAGILRLIVGHQDVEDTIH